MVYSRNEADHAASRAAKGAARIEGKKRHSAVWSEATVTKDGGQGRNRTADASLFRAALYQLSYLATDSIL